MELNEDKLTQQDLLLAMKLNPAFNSLDDVAALPCCACGKTQGVVAHHIKHKGAGGGDEFSNLLPLCMDCHIEIHKGQILFAQKHKSVREALRTRGWHIEMKQNQVLKLTREE